MAAEGNAGSVKLADLVPVQVLFVPQARTFSVDVGGGEKYCGSITILL